jgi:opacity protein-like surface antigen
MHRSERQITNSDEHGFGPTFDIKPTASLLFRASYRHFWRNAPDYRDENDDANISRMFDVAARDRDKVSLFSQYSPWDMLTLYAGFEFTNDRYHNSVLGLNNDLNYSPSVGAIYSPFDWIRLFVDYNWDRFDWLLNGMQRGTLLQDPRDPTTCDANCQLRLWNGRGREQIHTISLGTDVTLIKDILGFRLQYGFSDAASRVRNSGSTCLSTAGLPFPASGACTPATDYPTITSRWHELLARLEYQIHKNVALKVGYYYNRYNSIDHGVDIMKQWMGDQDQWGISGNANLGRSIFLGDQLKGPYTAHVGLVGLKLKF